MEREKEMRNKRREREGSRTSRGRGCKERNRKDGDERKKEVDKE